MINVKDQLGNIVHLSEVPKRIISLVPSQTELLFDLGLKDEVVGITKFCVHPKEWFDSKQRVGGTKKVNMGLVVSLQPDLIIANKEENTQEDIKALREIAPVWISDVVTYEDALDMIRQVGMLTAKEEEANRLVSEIDAAFNALDVPTGKPGKEVLYCIWNDPLMAVGKDTFIDEMLKKCGYSNCIYQSRYPIVEPPSIDPDYVFLSSEPFHFNQSHEEQIRKLFPKASVIRVDGEAFSWYGSRMLKSPIYFERLINQTV